MKNFIEVQNNYGNLVLINVNNIASVTVLRGECLIVFVGGKEEIPFIGTYTRETYDEIKTKIAQAIAE
jgi:hypothetical protein